MTAAQSLILRAAPAFLCLAISWTGIQCWFVQDDFAWLSLTMEVQGWPDLWRVLFAPMAQGTIRPLSERVYFMSLFTAFGMDALPFRIVAFATQAVNLVLLGSIAHRLTGSRAAAFCVPLFWGINPGLSVPMAWSSSYNQILCATFQLTAFSLFLRYCDTGRRRYYVWQCVVFLAGFGALELNVVYPALAFAYALVAARRFLPSTIPLGLVSAGYTVLHNWAAPKVQSGVYAMHFDGSILTTLGSYWVAAFGTLAVKAHSTEPWVHQAAEIFPWVCTAPLLAFVAWRASKRDLLPLFALLWFVIAIGPVLPLRDHFSEYYLTLPTIGLALAAGFAISRAVPARGVPLVLCVLLCGTYCAAVIPAIRQTLEFHHRRSKAVRDLVWSVEHIRQIHPSKIILLQGVNAGMFWAGIYDHPFRILGIGDVYLTPGSEKDIGVPVQDVEQDVLPAIAALRALRRGEAVVYQVSSFPLRNITNSYFATLHAAGTPAPAHRIDVGHRLFEDQLGDGWYPIEQGYRWIGRRARVWLAMPRGGPARLSIQGYCPEQQLEAGPLALHVTVNGKPLPPYLVKQHSIRFDADWPLPPNESGRDRVEVEVAVERTIRRQEQNREFGLAFGTFAVRPER